MSRAYGANATMSIARQSAYGVRATSGFYDVPFASSDLSAEQPLIPDAVLGYGRHPQDASYDVLTDTGNVTVPLDPRNIGIWLTGLLGNPVSALNKATGELKFTANPAAASTITLNGIVWTFVAGSPSGNQIQIGANLGATLDAAVTALNASVNASISVATYARPAGSNRLTIEHDTAGAAGNAYTLAASSTSTAKASAATLTGGGYRHRFVSGKDDLPSYTVQVGHPKIPSYEVHDSVVINTFALNYTRSGVAQAVFGCIAQGEEIFSTTQAGTPAVLALKRISQFNGSIKYQGERVANLTAGSFNYTNNYETIPEIRDDDRIGGADPTIPGITGSMTARYSNTGLITPAFLKQPVDLEFGYRLSASEMLIVTVPKVRLGIPKRPINGPGGVEAQFSFEAFQDQVSGETMIVDLINDLDGTQYV